MAAGGACDMWLWRVGALAPIRGIYGTPPAPAPTLPSNVGAHVRGEIPAMAAALEGAGMRGSATVLPRDGVPQSSSPRFLGVQLHSVGPTYGRGRNDRCGRPRARRLRPPLCRVDDPHARPGGRRAPRDGVDRKPAHLHAP